ncbi:hypothetical protein ZHAS_00013501 [Anopheles sinensis]|uniref:Uncharacterized protein n=1 Tax=Anopheles sinensis TaxID=74873 RepID=A0A084W5Q7_ANOSI|nr:hypothetical protein ZHAS_00013501 [Anopheles sinensis]
MQCTGAKATSFLNCFHLHDPGLSFLPPKAGRQTVDHSNNDRPAPTVDGVVPALPEAVESAFTFSKQQWQHSPLA